MTERGRIVCWDCDENAVIIDSPPKNAISDDFWCEKHCPKELKENWIRYKIKQELVTLDDFSKIWYPSTWINNEWHGWPYRPLEIHLWNQHISWWGTDGMKKAKEARNKRVKKYWWQFWK